MLILHLYRLMMRIVANPVRLVIALSHLVVWLLDHPLGIQIHREVFQSLHLEFQHLSAIEIFIFYSQTFLKLQLHQLRPSQLELVNGILYELGFVEVLLVNRLLLRCIQRLYLLLYGCI
jgi:hypothetical protein